MGWQTEKPEIWMRGSYDGHRRDCLGVQCSGSAGIVGCGPAGRPFSLELPRSILEGQYGCGLVGPAERSL
eukprot:631416-Pelagomonas_calceolata.AAC.1